MSGRGQDLASRLKAGIELQRAARRQEQERIRQQQAAALARGRTLLRDLGDFAKAVSFFKIVQSSERELVLAYENQHLAFRIDPKEPEQVFVTGDALSNTPARCYLEPTLRKWVLRWSPDGRPEEQQILFDRGLQALIEKAFSVRPIG